MNSFKSLFTGKQLQEWIYPWINPFRYLNTMLNRKTREVLGGLLLSITIVIVVLLVIYETLIWQIRVFVFLNENQIWQVRLLALLVVCACILLWHIITRPSRLRQWIYPQPKPYHHLVTIIKRIIKSFRVSLGISVAIAIATLFFYRTHILQVGLFVLLIVCICMFLWYIFTRPKNIIQPFNSNEETPEIKAYASKATDIFLETLRNIDKLLSSRQVEDFPNKPDDPLSVVMTNGGTQERIQELTSSVNINTSGVNFSLDKLMEFIIFYMARTRIHGLVQKRESGDLEISIEIVRRNNLNIYASRVIKRNNFTGFISDSVLNETIYELAVEIVMKSGEQNLPTSSWENLRDFLRGLEASAKKNWWHSVALYTNAIQKEEAIKGEFGLGHYHLGSILVSQGEPTRGLEHLRIAEASEFPTPDVYYMIALTLYYLHQNHLHEVPTNYTKHQTTSHLHENNRHEETIDSNRESRKLEATSQIRWIEQIEIYCNKAFSLKNEFPEAYHLLGISHYQAGKLWERRDIKRHTYHYKKTIKYLNKSIKQYATKINDLSYENQINFNSQEKTRLFKNYIAVTHRLASASRSLRKFTQAETYYQEILEITPANIQNLVDLAKTYCLANEWDKVESLYKNKIAHLDGAAWNVDVNFYRSWAQAGMLADKKVINKEDLKLLRRAFEHLDYALYQRPRFISSWKQTEWEATFKKAAEHFQSLSQEVNGQDTPDIWVNSILHMNNWLGWRIDSYDDKDEDDKPKNWKEVKEKHLFLSIDIDYNCCHYPEFTEFYRKLKLLRKRTKFLLKNIDRSGDVGGIINHWIRLSWAQEAIVISESAHNILSKKVDDNIGNHNKVTFGYRWAIDVYAEVSLLACRLLAECRDYENMYCIASKAGNLLNDWLSCWNANTGKDEDDNERFSPRVFEHQIATTFAWKAYALVQLKNDPEAQARSEEKCQKDKSTPQEEIDKAFKHRPFHPLAIYVQAQIYRVDKLNRLAIDRLTFLLSLIESFDPKTFINSSVYLKKSTMPENEMVRFYYYYMERVSGQQQFEDFIDRTRIHMEIAELFTLENDIKSSVEHYLMAPTWSPYKDMDAKNLMRLVNQLYRLGRFDEAFSVIQEIYIRQPLMLNSSSKIKGQETEIMECVIRTRLNDHHSSLEKGLSLSKAVPLLSFNELTGLFTHLEHKKLNEYFRNRGYDTESEELKILSLDEGKGLASCFEAASKIIIKKSNNPNLEGKLNDIHKSLKVQNPWITPDIVLLRACMLLNIANVKDIQERLSKDERFNLMAGHLAYFLCKKSLTILIHEADLSNNIAYNQAELRIELNNAELRSIYSIEILEFIADCMIDPNSITSKNSLTKKKGKRSEGVSPGRIGKLLSKDYYKEKFGGLISGEQILEKLSLYYDSLGWIYYRQKDLENAHVYLAEALRYNSNTTSAHYHLARVFLTQYEIIWQTPIKRNILKDIEDGTASKYLRSAFYHANRAQELDTVHRFENKLLVLKTRIQSYRVFWDEIHFEYGKKISKEMWEKLYLKFDK